MATGTATGKARCSICEKEKSTLRCEGCSQAFCYEHVADHRQQLSNQFDGIETNRDVLRLILTDQIREAEKYPLIQQIDKWEHDSINIIKRTAEEAKQQLIKLTTTHFTDIEVKLNKLTNQLRESRREDDFVETDLYQWNDELKKLKEQLDKPPNIVARQDAIPFVNKLCIGISAQLYIPTIDINTKWIRNGVVVCGGNGSGTRFDQLDGPYSLFIDDDDNECMYIADHDNHRIVKWKNSSAGGQVVAGGNKQGDRHNQLSNPKDVIIDKETDSLIICDYGNKRVVQWPLQDGTRGKIIISDIACYGIVMDNNGHIYVSDYIKHEVKRWKMGETEGIVVAGGNGEGNRLDQLNNPTYIFVDKDQSVYVSDESNHRVMKWMKDAKQGIVVAGNHGRGNKLKQLSNPSGVVVDQSGTVYVADYKNDRIMRWFKETPLGDIVVGGRGWGNTANQFNGPRKLLFDRQGNLYVVDYWNNRVQKFHIFSNTNI
ncbi:unnamed protein product [Adineta steineri]|uniref:Uncharacterized protein n=1 Tax=Adineta steineri TaxID=433720 RepID=A0A813NT32_9BILA|nr:unnamed protein product [Adineta steineri]CAF3594543.1 unnamed protein product [Adineta steineri]